MFDLISIGDTTLDTFLELEDANVFCDLDKNNCQLCINYADKIPVKSVAQAIGGNAANVAVGTSRLGLKTALVSIVGDDPIGQQLSQKLKAEKVASDYIVVDKGKKTNNSTILNLRGERTILIYHEVRDYCLNLNLGKTKFAYITSMKDGWECMMAKEGLFDWIDEHQIRVAYNPGTYQIKAGIANSAPLLQKTEILFVNKQEARNWLKLDTNDFGALGRGLIKYGPKIVVITDGENGSYAITDKDMIHQEIYKTQKIEATGAGDAYASAFISAIASGESIEQAMRWGSLNSASVISEIGSQAGLLSRDKMEKRLKFQISKTNPPPPVS